jgi:TctA family transporter
MLEEHFHRSMVLSHGEFGMFLERPVSLVLLILTALIIVSAIYSRFFSRRLRPIAEEEEA